MKLSKRDIGLLAGVFGVLLAVAVYSLLYIPYLDKTAALEAELITLQEQEQRYKDMEENKEFYEQGIERLTTANNEILAQFPADIQPESEIMYVVELEDQIDIEIPSISYGSASPLLGEEGNAEGIQAYLIPMNVSYTTSYQGLKDAITYTNDHQNRMVIDTVSVSYDSTTGLVSGGMTFNLYYMTGTDNVYQEPYVPDIPLGTSNIFGTIQ